MNGTRVLLPYVLYEVLEERMIRVCMYDDRRERERESSLTSSNGTDSFSYTRRSICRAYLISLFVEEGERRLFARGEFSP